jgi:hypothetical protein
MKNYFFWTALLLFFSACQNSQQQLKGLWLFVGEYEVVGKDTFHRRRPILLDIREGYLFRVSFANQQGVSTKIDSLPWTMAGDFMVIQTDQKDSFRIFYQTKDSLVLGFQQTGYTFAQAYKKQTKASGHTAEEIRKTLYTQGIFQLQNSALKAEPSKPVEVEFFKNRYLYSNVQQATAFIWEVVAYGDQAYLIYDALMGTPLSWDIVALDDLQSGNIRGHFYHKMRPYTLNLSPSKNIEPELGRKIAKEMLPGTWVLSFRDPERKPFLPPGKDLPKGQPIETFTFLPDGKFEQDYLGNRFRGTWEQSKSGRLFLLADELKQQYSYLLVESLGEQSFDATYCPRMAQNREAALRFDRQK